MLRNTVIWIILICLSLCSGCASSSNRYINFLSQYHISPLPSEKRINKIVGLNNLTDNRPLKEKDDLPFYCGKLDKPASDIVTLILLKDFKKSRLFKEIHYPAQPTDDIIINGSINGLFTDFKLTSWGKFSEVDFPIIRFFPFLFCWPDIFGVPVSEGYTVIDISLEVKDNKTGVIITPINASSKEEQKNRIFIFYPTKNSAAIAFCNVAKKLKKDLAEKINAYSNK